MKNMNELMELLLNEILDASRELASIVKFDVHSPGQVISPEKSAVNKDMGAVRAYMTVSGCDLVFVVELVRLMDSFIDINFGVISGSGSEAILTERQRSHMFSKISNSPFDSEALAVLDIDEVRDAQQRCFIPALDWKWLVRLETITDDDLFYGRNEEAFFPDYFEFPLLSCVLTEFINIFARESIVLKGGTSV